MRHRVGAFNEDDLDNPIVPCTCIGFHPPAEGEGFAVFVVVEDTRPHMMLKKTWFFFTLLSGSQANGHGRPAGVSYCFVVAA